MIIGGLQKFSLLDYPGKVSAIVFTKGCNFKCHFCYNPMLVLPLKARHKKGHSLLTEDDLFVFLKSRVGKLEAVVITGGEPTLHKDLPKFIEKIKDLGFKIKLDTNGTNPEMLKKLIISKLVDYIAMDIKAPLEKYKKITGAKVSLSKIKKSIKIIMNSGLPYEFRTTIVPGLIGKEDIAEMGKLIKGAKIWFFQQFKPNTDLVDKEFKKIMPYKDEELEEMRRIGSKYVGKYEIR